MFEFHSCFLELTLMIIISFSDIFINKDATSLSEKMCISVVKCTTHIYIQYVCGCVCFCVCIRFIKATRVSFEHFYIAAETLYLHILCCLFVAMNYY